MDYRNKRKTQRKKEMTRREIDKYNLTISAASLGVSSIGLLVAIAALNKKSKKSDCVIIYENR